MFGLPVFLPILHAENGFSFACFSCVYHYSSASSRAVDVTECHCDDIESLKPFSCC
jgi:hypothetical protein